MLFALQIPDDDDELHNLASALVTQVSYKTTELESLN